MKLQPTTEIATLVLIFGLLLLAYGLFAALLTKWRLPAVIGGIAVGMMVRELVEVFPVLMPERSHGLLDFAGTVGIVCLLFRVGLEADFACLRRQFRDAVFLWITNVSTSAIAGFAAARWWLQYDLITSLIIAVALSATSVGIPVEVWRNRGQLHTSNGQRFVEVAELDDISAVLLMALLFSLIPSLSEAQSGEIWSIMGGTLAWFTLKLAFFFALCWAFARYAEEPITDYFQKTHPIVGVAGMGFILSALAGLLGFSVAVGAFFAGLAYSRDPRAVKIDAQFDSLYEFFTPFFFIYLGFQVPVHILGQGLSVGVVLLLVAVLGKLLGTVFPARLTSTWKDSLTFGVSMVPRAEIALLIVATAGALGGHHLPDGVFPGMIVVTLVTSLVVPLTLEQLLKTSTSLPNASIA